MSIPKAITPSIFDSRPTRRSSGPSNASRLDTPHAIAFGQVDDKPGSEILVLEGQSSRGRVLTLDQSAADDSNKRGRLAFFALPQGNEHGRSLDVGDLNGDKRTDVIVSDPANAQVWVYLQSGTFRARLGTDFPRLGNARTVRVIAGQRRPGRGLCPFRTGEADRPEHV